MVRACVRIKDIYLATLALVAVACGGADSAVSPPPPPLHLTIEVRYLAPLTVDEQRIVAAAADKWTHALLTDIGSFQLNSPANECFAGEPTLNELHRNLLLYVSARQVDGVGGVIAFTQVCAQSARDLLPIVSHIRLDRDDLSSVETRGLLSSIVTHEMGHALGFNPQVYTRKGFVSGGTADPYFTGSAARTEFAKRLPSYTGNAVPLEDMGQLGDQSSHWRWSVFGDELMIGPLLPGYTYPLSSVTLGLFKDIGYDVDMSKADPYPILSFRAEPVMGERALLENDVVAPRVGRIIPPTIAR
jgi:hypothetical protein